MEKTIIVTGATRGLGGYIAKAAHDTGYRVIGLARKLPETPLAYECRMCDVANYDQVTAALDDLRRDESLYGLINAAGVASMNLAISTPPESMRNIVATNLLGTMYSSAIVGKWLSRRKNGRIINFSTIAVAIGLKGESVYCASKAGVEGFSRSFAREMADFGVTVNVIAPGPIDTDLIRHVPKANIDALVERQVITRQATPSAVWDIVSFLLGPTSEWVAGQVFNVGGV